MSNDFLSSIQSVFSPDDTPDKKKTLFYDNLMRSLSPTFHALFTEIVSLEDTFKLMKDIKGPLSAMMTPNAHTTGLNVFPKGELGAAGADGHATPSLLAPPSFPKYDYTDSGRNSSASATVNIIDNREINITIEVVSRETFTFRDYQRHRHDEMMASTLGAVTRAM